MHVIDPAAGNVAVVFLAIFATIVVVGLLLFVVGLADLLPYKVEDFLESLAIPALIAVILSVFAAIGCSFAADADIQNQLKAQSQSRYGIQLTQDQMNDLWDVKSHDTRTGTIDGRKVKLLGSTITNNSRVITLVETGENTYLLESANLTELPTER